MKKNIYVTKPVLPPKEEYFKEISEIWDNNILTNSGQIHKKLLLKLKKLLNVKYAELFCNGHMALELTITALGLKGEIITTPFSFVSTSNAICRAGCKPVFCDIKSADFTIDERKITELITEKTVGILPVHVYGNICNVEAISKIAREYNLKVIYDSAHAFGEKYKGRPVAEYGDASVFSFHATKVFNTAEGGLACFKKEEYCKVAEKLKNFGIASEESVEYIGPNAKLSEFHAALGVCNLDRLSENILKRKTIVEKYVENLKSISGIKLPVVKDYIEYNYSYFYILVDESEYGLSRDELYEKLKANNIFSRKYFYPIISDYTCYNKYNCGSFEIAKKVSKEILVLPLYPNLSYDDVDRICEIIKKEGKYE